MTRKKIANVVIVLLLLLGLGISWSAWEPTYAQIIWVREKSPFVYSYLPRARIAQIATSDLQHGDTLNNWGYLDPKESYDGEYARALIDAGPAALPVLQPLLHDKRPAPLEGSEDATMFSVYQYRRADFAYRYVCLILGIPPKFDKSPEVRDQHIEDLLRYLQNRN